MFCTNIYIKARYNATTIRVLIMTKCTKKSPNTILCAWLLIAIAITPSTCRADEKILTANQAICGGIATFIAGAIAGYFINRLKEKASSEVNVRGDCIMHANEWQKMSTNPKNISIRGHLIVYNGECPYKPLSSDLVNIPSSAS